MTQFNVAQLLKEGVGGNRSHTIDDKYNLESGAPQRLRGHVDLLRTDKGVFVSGRIEIGTADTCSRCLKDFTAKVSFPIEEEFLPVIDVNTGLKLEVAEDDVEGGLVISEGHILDLSEAVRQYVIVHAPLKPLCRQDCAGLCGACGADMNQGEHACEGARNPKWSALYKLLK